MCADHVRFHSCRRRASTDALTTYDYHTVIINLVYRDDTNIPILTFSSNQWREKVFVAQQKAPGHKYKLCTTCEGNTGCS